MGLRVRVRGSAAALSCPQRRRPVRPASGWPALAQRSGPARRSHCSERLVLYPPPSGRSYCSSRSVWRRSLAESRQSRPRRTTFLRFAAKGLSRISLPCRSDYVSTFRGDECRSAMSLPCPRRTGFQRFATTTLGARPRLVVVGGLRFDVSRRGCARRAYVSTFRGDGCARRATFRGFAGVWPRQRGERL